MAWQGHPSRRILDETALDWNWSILAHLHVRPCMRDAGGGPEHYRDVEFLRQLQAIDRHIPGLLGIGRIQTGNGGELGEAS